MNLGRRGVVFAILPILFVIGMFSCQALAASGDLTVHYEKQQKTSTIRDYHDLSSIDLAVTNILVLPMDDTPKYNQDDADLIKVTVRVTSNSSDYFVLQDKMFELWIMKPSKSDSSVLEAVDTFDTTYDDEFAVIYEKMNSRELFNECDQTIKSLLLGKPLEFTLCYNILKIRNDGGIKMDDQKKYVLVMMDNQQTGSCPNCKKILLPIPDQEPSPDWIGRLFEWKNQGLISEKDLQNSLNYLASVGISTSVQKTDESDFALALKNKEFARYQNSLAEAYGRNLFVSSIKMFQSVHEDKFTGVVCKKQNNIITLDADYTNEDARYGTIFFRLKVYDDFGNPYAEGLAKIVDVAPKSFRHLSVSTPSIQNASYCEVRVDSKFP